MAQRVLVPPLGQTTDTVILSAWYKQVGDTVNAGEPLFAIETDKAILDIEAPASGVLAQRSGGPGDSITVLSTIGLIADVNEQIEPEVGEAPSAPERDREAAPSAQPARETPGPPRIAGQSGNRLFVSPRARRLAEAESIELAALMGTGPEHAIVERDVRAYLKERARALPVGRDEQPASLPEEVSPRQGLGRNAVLSAEVDASAIVTLRERLGSHGIDVSLTAIMLYVVSRALKRNPLSDANADLEISVLTAAGSATHVIHNASAKSLLTLGQELTAAPAEGPATDWQRQPPAAGLVCVDLGSQGIDTYAPALEGGGPPTLAIGRLKRHPHGNTTMWLSLSVADLPAGMRLMQSITQLAEDPDRLF